MNITNIQEVSSLLLEVLPHGSNERIANECSMNRNSITPILKGKWKNERVVNKAIEIIRERYEKMEELLSIVDGKSNPKPMAHQDSR